VTSIAASSAMFKAVEAASVPLAALTEGEESLVVLDALAGLEVAVTVAVAAIATEGSMSSCLRFLDSFSFSFPLRCAAQNIKKKIDTHHTNKVSTNATKVRNFWPRISNEEMQQLVVGVGNSNNLC
jgi:hypothetical protein